MTDGRSTEGRTITVADPFQPVLVRWMDAHAGEGSWHSLDEHEGGDHVVATVGWLIPENEGGKLGHVTVAQNVDPNELVDHVIYIPQLMVQALTFLQPFTKGLKG